MHIKEINIKNRVYNYFDNLINPKKLETKYILLEEKSYKDLVFYFTRYIQRKSIKMMSLYYQELMGKIKKHERKKNGWLMIIY